MAAILQVELTEIFGAMQPCKHFIDARQWPQISDGVAIQGLIINTHAQTTTTFLFGEQYGCTIKAAAWYNMSRLKQFMHLPLQPLQLEKQ